VTHFAVEDEINAADGFGNYHDFSFFDVKRE